MTPSEKELDEQWVFHIGGINTSLMKCSAIALVQELAGSYQKEIKRESKDVGVVEPPPGCLCGLRPTLCFLQDDTEWSTKVS